MIIHQKYTVSKYPYMCPIRPICVQGGNQKKLGKTNTALNTRICVRFVRFAKVKARPRPFAVVN